MDAGVVAEEAHGTATSPGSVMTRDSGSRRCRRKLAGPTRRKNAIPNMRKVTRHPSVEMSHCARGKNSTAPSGFPASASPSIQPRVRGNHGARVAAVVKEEMLFSPSVATTL
jgi:hypothetical protein